MITQIMKQDLLIALSNFVRQRPGLEYGNYGDVTSYRAESRGITRDLHDYETLLHAVQQHDSITVDDLVKASRSAFSGRLEIVLPGERGEYNPTLVSNVVRIEYCVGQYFPTEYRKAACALLASALWTWQRDHAMPAPVSSDKYQMGSQLLTAGDWLRRRFRRRFGHHLASRWFN